MAAPLFALQSRIHSLAHWVGPAVTAAGAVGLCAAVALRDPREEGSFGICPWLFATGTHCPGCGFLRSLNRLVNVDVTGAVGYNIIVVATIPVVIYAWLRWALPNALRCRLPSITALPPNVFLGFAVTLLVFWFGRNLPWEPFAWFAPSGS